MITFHFERAGMAVPRYSITLDASGRADYRGEEEARPDDGAASAGRLTPFERKGFATPNGLTERLFAKARELSRSPLHCASDAKNVASTGAKTLTYRSASGEVTSCGYDSTENKDVESLTEIFEGIAEMMNEGRRLEYLHRYDRLGLDAAMDSLAKEVAAGRAIAPGTIADTLRSIADDPQVIKRVRVRAADLLASATEDAGRH